MKLNVMIASLASKAVAHGPNVRLGRPIHYANLVTHNALLRRGLIAEADDDFHTTTITDAGREALKAVKGERWGTSKVVLTKLQAFIVEHIRAGRSESWVTARLTGDSSTYHSHKVALRRKGVITMGRRGVAGSVRVLVAYGDYDVDQSSKDVPVLEKPFPTKYQKKKAAREYWRSLERQYAPCY